MTLSSEVHLKVRHLLRGFWSRALLSCLCFLIALIAGEFVVRFYLVHQNKILRDRIGRNILTRAPLEEIFEPASSERFTHKRNYTVHWWGMDISTDSLGCRIGPPAPDSARTILFVGDSMVFGVGLADSSTIPARLQIELTRLVPDRAYRVLNAGVIGQDFEQYLHHLERLLSEVDPDLILIGICINDLYPTEDPFGNAFAMERPSSKAAAASSVQPAGRESRLVSGAREIFHYSALLTLLRQTILLARSSGRMPSANPFEQRRLEQAPELIARYDALFTATGKRYGFVYFPDYRSLKKEASLEYVRLLKIRGFKLLDLSQSDSLDLECYFAKQSTGQVLPEMHFNNSGSRLVAGEIARWLIAQGLAGN